MKTPRSKDDKELINLRMEKSIIAQIEEFRKKCEIPVTRTYFIKKAILEKIERCKEDERE